VIDVHTHLGRIGPVRERPGCTLSVQQLLNHMDREGVEYSVLLPLESPEGASGYWTTEEALEAWAMYPERLVPFVAADPRMVGAVEQVQYFAERGCRGFGEHKTGLAFDDPRSMRLYAICHELGWPLLFHSDPELNFDEVGLPRLERCLQELPDVKFIGHGPGFWSAISPDDDRSGGYPGGPIKAGGAVDRLLGAYPNLYADISAGSGHNALTRDPGYTGEFIERHWRKLLFGTDYLHPHQELPQFQWLREAAPVTDEQREAIAAGNAAALLGLA